MSTIPINKKQSEILKSCCQKLNIQDDFKSKNSVWSNVTGLKLTADDLRENAENLYEAIRSFMIATSENDTETLIQCLKLMTDLTEEISQDAAAIKESTTDTVAEFKSNTEVENFVLLCSDEHIKKVICENLIENRSMFVGYKDGEFALGFCELVDDTEQPPFLIEVIAKGDYISYEDVQEYIEQFMDIQYD